MGIKEMAAAVGKRCMVTVYLSDSITFPAEIKDVRQSYGRLDYQITPVDGEGLIWVSGERVTLTAEEV